MAPKRDISMGHIPIHMRYRSDLVAAPRGPRISMLVLISIGAAIGLAAFVVAAMAGLIG